jgi:hypothetical protein
MCNACGFSCCAFDGFEGCGCDWCECSECWSTCEECGQLEEDCGCHEGDLDFEDDAL